MEKQYLSRPDFPSFSRFLYFLKVTRTISITRALQYEKLEQQKFSGIILDVGGGEKANYRYLINCDTYHSINIDTKLLPTWDIKVGEAFPCSHDSYDFVVSLNTFEHIYDLNFVLRQIFNSLKYGGRLIAMLPFLFPIHGHPDDFVRLTPSWFIKTLPPIGYKEIEITPLTWGPFTTGLIASGTPGPVTRFRRNNALLLDLLYSYVHRYRGTENELADNMYRTSLAFLIQAEK